MPGKVKLLNAAPAGTTGLAYKIGTASPPITIRTDGGYVVGSGSAGTNGVIIEVSSDGGTTWAIAMGMVGGGTTDASTANFTDLADKSLASMPYYPGGHVRARTGANMTGSATVYMEFPR